MSTKPRTPKSMIDPNGGCGACHALRRIGVLCNTHRHGTENRVDALIRRAREAGHDLPADASKVEQALIAERLLGAKPVMLG